MPATFGLAGQITKSVSRFGRSKYGYIIRTVFVNMDKRFREVYFFGRTVRICNDKLRLICVKLYFFNALTVFARKRSNPSGFGHRRTVGIIF